MRDLKPLNRAEIQRLRSATGLRESKPSTLINMFVRMWLDNNLIDK